MPNIRMRNGVAINVDMPMESGDEIIIGNTRYTATQQPNGEFNLQAIPDMPRNNVNRDFQGRQEEQRQHDRRLTAEEQAARVAAASSGTTARNQSSSIVDQLRPWVEQSIHHWQEHAVRTGMVFYDSAASSQSRYTAGVDPIGATPNVHVYDGSRLTYQHLEDIMDGITGAPGQRLGQDNSSAANVLGICNSLYSSSPRESTIVVAREGTNSITWGWDSSKISPKRTPDMSAEQAAAELAAEALKKQEAEADEWLKSSPWG